MSISHWRIHVPWTPMPLYSRQQSSAVAVLPLSEFYNYNHTSMLFHSKLPLRRSFLLRLLCSIFMLFIAAGASAQTATEQSAILKLCMDLPSLQEHYKAGSGSAEQVHVMQFPVAFSPEVSVTKFDRPVIFQTRGDARNSNPDVLLSFKTLSVKENTATVVFDFYYGRKTSNPELIEVTAVLAKNDGTWSIINSTLKN